MSLKNLYKKNFVFIFIFNKKNFKTKKNVFSKKMLSLKKCFFTFYFYYYYLFDLIFQKKIKIKKNKKNSLLDIAKISQCVIFAIIANFRYDSENFRYGPSVLPPILFRS